ncbi:FAD-binding oxidoreductase, partial [Pseudomonas syringae pv. tagetis]
PINVTAMVLGTSDFNSIMPVLDAFHGKLDLTAFEFFSDNSFARVMARGDVPSPFDTPCPMYVLQDFDAATEDLADQALASF